jgi:hypothetical protein
LKIAFPKTVIILNALRNYSNQRTASFC